MPWPFVTDSYLSVGPMGHAPQPNVVSMLIKSKQKKQIVHILECVHPALLLLLLTTQGMKVLLLLTSWAQISTSHLLQAFVKYLAFLHKKMWIWMHSQNTDRKHAKINQLA